MPVERHPRYQAWRKAQDRFIEADERYREAVRNVRSPAEIEFAKIERRDAEAAYQRILNEIDYANRT
jgi:hypothetical protein